MESLIYKTVHYDNLVELKKRLKLHVPMLDDKVTEEAFSGADGMMDS
jgi:hypothetical protein